MDFGNELEDNILIELFDITGRKKISDYVASKNNIKLILPELKNGIYNLKIVCGDKVVSRKIVVVQ
jgi:hypothetical protein